MDQVLTTLRRAEPAAVDEAATERPQRSDERNELVGAQWPPLIRTTMNRSTRPSPSSGSSPPPTSKPARGGLAGERGAPHLLPRCRHEWSNSRGYRNYAMAWLANPTVMVRHFHSWCTIDTDVIWEFGNIDRPNGVRGVYTCRRRSGSVCHQATLRIDPVVTGDMVNHRKTACHELGHSVGLRHSTQCMMSGAAPDDSIQYRRYRPHHIWHINDHY